MARPTKLDDERQAKIVDYLRSGVPQEAAAYASGITARTLHAWKARGQKAIDKIRKDGDEEPPDDKIPVCDRPFVQFLHAVDAARHEAEARMALFVARAAQTDPKWAAWWLDRAFPERWAQRQQMTVQQEGEVTVVIEGW